MENVKSLHGREKHHLDLADFSLLIENNKYNYCTSKVLDTIIFILGVITAPEQINSTSEWHIF